MIISAGCKDYMKNIFIPRLYIKILIFMLYIYVDAVYGDNKQPLTGMEFI